MGFVYRRTLNRKPSPVRIYLHEAGHQLFSQPYRDSTRLELDDVREKYPDILKPAEFIIAALWGS